MGILDRVLPYEDFFRNEYKTLGFLQKNPTIANAFYSLANNASIQFNSYKGILNKKTPSETRFEFCCELDIIVENDLRRIFVESVVLPDYSLSSYMYAICSGTSPDTYSLLRKYHFDFAPPIEGQYPKPVFHLQYGGEKLRCSSVDVEPLHPWLSGPRINYSPINLALLLDQVFTEFREDNIAAARLIELSEWRNLIKNNEDLILRPYYEGIQHFIRGEHSSRKLLRDYYYGG